MNARNSAAGDGPADAGNALADQPDPYERQIEALERLIAEHQAAHAARIETLQRQSGSYLSTLAEEKRQLQAARQRFRSGEAVHGEDPRNAEALKA